MKDIDTQIDEILAVLAHQVYLNAHSPGYTKLTPKNQKFLKEAHKAIKTLLIQSKIDELERLKKIDAFNEAYSNDPRPSRLVSIRIDQLKEELT